MHMNQTLHPIRLTLAMLGFLAISFAIWRISDDFSGLQQIRFEQEGIPVTVWAPAGSDVESHPLVMIGHGFSASQEMMNGYTLALAHAGYTVATWDFDGHGQNQNRLRAGGLVANAERVRVGLVSRRLTDNQRVAILGHSMGSGVAMEFGLRKPEIMAVIAISPVERSVNPLLPHNLLLMAGELEPMFLHSAEIRLAEAGGEGGDPQAGNARALVRVPGVEHISILFSTRAQQAARDWLDATFGPQVGGRTFTDLRLIWYSIGVLGFALVAAALAPERQKTLPEAAGATPRLVAGLIGGALGAPILLWLASRAGIDLGSLLGVAVGGYLLIWFGLAGLIAGLVGGVYWDWPSRRGLRGALSTFAALWLGVGWLGSQVWLHWSLSGTRLLLWPVGVALLLPWMLAVGQCLERSRWPMIGVWWLAHSLVLVISLMLAYQLNRELSFILISLPLFPVMLACHALAVGPQPSRWAFGLSAAAFLSWLILAVFPLV